MREWCSERTGFHAETPSREGRIERAPETGPETGQKNSLSQHEVPAFPAAVRDAIGEVQWAQERDEGSESAARDAQVAERCFPIIPGVADLERAAQTESATQAE
jgi:hypothetical protein